MTSKFVVPVLITALGGIISMLAYDVMKVNGYSPLESVATQVHEVEPVATQVHEVESVATEEPFDILIRKANQGDVKAQYDLGYMYLEEGINQDYEKALEWLTKAANQGSGNAQLMLTAIYSDDEIVEKDENISRQWFMKACLPNLESNIEDCEELFKSGEWVWVFAWGGLDN